MSQVLESKSTMSAQDSQQMTLSIRPKPGQPKKKEKVNEKIEVLWESYFGPNDNNLAKWKQLCCDLGKPGETYTSKTQCRKVRSPLSYTGT